MLKYLLWMLLGAGVTTGVIYGVPDEMKERFLALLSRPKVIPIELRNKIESLLLSPVEQREKLLKQLEDNLTELKTIAAQKDTEVDKKIVEKIAETEQLIKELKKKNEEKPGVVQSTINKIIEEVVPGGGGVPGLSEQRNNCPP